MIKIKLEKLSKLLEHNTPIMLENENGDILFIGYYDLLDENSNFEYWLKDYKNFYVLGIGFGKNPYYKRDSIIITIFMNGKRVNKIGVSQVQKVAPEKEMNCTKEKQYNIYDYLGGEKWQKYYRN